MPVEIKYNGSTIANLEGGQTATLPCNGKKMKSDLTVIAPEGGGGGINIVDELPEVGVEGEYYGLMTFTDLYIRDGDEGGFMSGVYPPTAKPYFKKAPTLDLAEVKAKIENGGYITCLLYLTEYGDKPNLYTIGVNEFTPIEDQMETPFIGEITDTTNATDVGMYAYMSPVVYQYINGAYKLSIPRE